MAADDPAVRLQRPRAAKRLERAVLERPEELGLDRQAERSDFVQEERAAVGPGEPAVLPRERAGEGALLVAEELRLEERLGDRAAVHLDEGPIPAGAERVQRVSDQFLARAARPLDEHGGGARRDLLHHSKHGGDGPALPDDAAERRVGSVVELLPEPAVVGRQRLLVERPRHHPLEVGSLEWLRDKVVGAALDGPARRAGCSRSR